MHVDPAYQLGKLYDAPHALQTLLKHIGYSPAWLPSSCSACSVRVVDSRMRPKDVKAALGCFEACTCTAARRRLGPHLPSEQRRLCFHIAHDPLNSESSLKPAVELRLDDGGVCTTWGLVCFVTYTDNLRYGGHYHTWQKHRQEWASNEQGPLLYHDIPPDMPVLAVYEEMSCTAGRAAEQLSAWRSNARFGPCAAAFDPLTPWRLSDRWDRATTLLLSPSTYVRQLLYTWPELNVAADDAIPTLTGTRMLRSGPPIDEVVACASCHKYRLRDGHLSPTGFTCQDVSGWSCDVPGDTTIGGGGSILPDIAAAGAQRQPVSGVLCLPCRMPSGRPRARTTFGSIKVMRQRTKTLAFEVSTDTGPTGSKAYMTFPNIRAFFRETALLGTRNFYEIIPPNTPCCLYFDLEHYTATSASDNRLNSTVSAISAALADRWPDMPTTCAQHVVILDGSRSTNNSYKHSFHLIFPRIGFDCNHGQLRIMAKQLSTLPNMQACGRNGRPQSLLDAGVYTRNQNFRLVESWKFHPQPSSEMVLRFRSHSQHTLAELMESVVTNTAQVTYWCRDDEAVVTASKLLHARRLDGLLITHQGIQGIRLPFCPCSHMPLRNTDSQQYATQEDKEQVLLCCPHVACRRNGASQMVLGRADCPRADRSRPDPSAVYNALQQPSAAGEHLEVDSWGEPFDTAQIDGLLASCARTRGWSFGSTHRGHTLLLDMQAANDWGKVVSGPGAGDAGDANIPGGVMWDGWEVLIILLPDPVNRQWMALTVCRSLGRVDLEMAVGQPRRSFVRQVLSWVVRHTKTNTADWRFFRLGSELCSSPSNSLALLIAGLWLRLKHVRYTGEAAYSLRALLHAHIRTPNAELDNGLHAGVQGMAAVEWLEIDLPAPAPGSADMGLGRKVSRQSHLPFESIPDPPASASTTLPELDHDNLTDQTVLTVEAGCAQMPHRGLVSSRSATPRQPSRSWFVDAGTHGRSVNILSQNVGPVGVWKSAHTLRQLVDTYCPAVIFLQDCRVKTARRDDTKAMLRRLFPDYQNFVQCEKSPSTYPFSVITLTHEVCGPGTVIIPPQEHNTGARLLSVRLTCGRQNITLTNGYNYQATDARQDLFFRELHRRVEASAQSGEQHIVGGDFNASLLPASRLGYTAGGAWETADRRMLSLVQSPSLSRGWARGSLVKGVWSWRSQQRAQAARLDEILLHRPEPFAYELYSVEPVNPHWDHCTVVAEMQGILPQPTKRLAAVRLQVPDGRAWQEQPDAWRAAVFNKAESISFPSEVYENLQTWADIAHAQLPRKMITVGGPPRAGTPHANKEQRKTRRLISTLERALLVTYTPGCASHVVHQITSWRHPDTKFSALPLDFDGAQLKQWLADIQNALQGLRARLRALESAQQKASLARMREAARERMDRPGEGEIKRLLGKNTVQTPVTFRASRVLEKRHPDCLRGRMSPEAWKTWLCAVLGTSFEACLAQAWRAQGADPLCFRRQDHTVEITRESASELCVRVSPMTTITRLMECAPALTEGEYIRLLSSPQQRIRHVSDALCHEETFFGTNAIDARAFCGHCERLHPNSSRGKEGLTACSKLTASGHREIRYICRDCHAVRSTLPSHSLPPCPIPRSAMAQASFDPSSLVLTRPLSWEDFQYWLRQLPSRKSAGEDGITYEMWKEAPLAMRRSLYEAVQRALCSGDIPAAWQNATVTLLGKKAGMEEILECTRPICLMATAAKMVTGIWAYRLSNAAEQRGVFEDAQEGFRPSRSTKRQVVRLLSCLQAIRTRRGKAFVAFLDFENYFNTISLEALFHILRACNLHEADVSALERYYSEARMQVRHADGSLSAKVKLSRGLRQGCPLSPVLGGLVVNVMIRGLAAIGGGTTHPSGARLNTLVFADDTTFLTESLLDMQRLFDNVHQFCAWAGVHISLGKSEVTGYDYGNARPLVTKSLRIGGGHPQHILPSTPFKYLGVRLTVVLDMAAERQYVLAETGKLLQLLRKHRYQPSQIHWLVTVAIVPVFRYSAALAEWDTLSLATLNRLWVRAFKYAWRVPIGTPSLPFQTPTDFTGLGIVTAESVLAEEVVSLMRQCTGNTDNLYDIMQADMCQALLDLGCSTIPEAQATISRCCGCFPAPLQDPRCHSNICTRFLAWTAPSVTVAWSSLTQVPTTGPNMNTLQRVMGPLAASGVSTLVADFVRMADSDQADPQHVAELQRCLLLGARLGLHRLADLVTNDTITIPLALQQGLTDNANSLLDRAATSAQWRVEYERPIPSAVTLTPSLRPGRRGCELAGGQVWRLGKAGRTQGTVLEYLSDTDRYRIRFQDSDVKEWTLQQVCAGWMERSASSTWTAEDQRLLGSQVVGVVGRSQGRITQRVTTPFPTRLDDTEWSVLRHWYTCQVEWRLPPSIRDMVDVRGSRQDLLIAEKICAEGAPFWVPPSTWTWESTSTSTKYGWFVRAVNFRQDVNGVVLVVRSLHQHDFHREGDLAVSGPVSLRSVIQDHHRRPGLIITLSAAEMGDPSEGGFQICDALKAWQKEEPAAALPIAASVPIPRRVARHSPPLAPVQFEEDMTSLELHSEAVGEGLETVQVVVTGGQAFCQAPADTNDHAPPHGAKRRRRLQHRVAQHKPSRQYAIEATRWDLMKQWYGKDAAVQEWRQQWRQLSEWERQGGRSVHWSVTSKLRHLWNLDAWVGKFRLAADPSFQEYRDTSQTCRGIRCCVLAYELMECNIAGLAQKHLSRGGTGVLLIATSQISRHDRAELKRLGRCAGVLCKGDRVCLRKGWWIKGERSTIKNASSVEIWTNLPSAETDLRAVLLDDSESWWPNADGADLSPSLDTYLRALPGRKYQAQGCQLVATDGSLRMRRGALREPSMGAGVAWDDGATAADQVGGPLSSTRAELAAISICLDGTAPDRSLAILCDSTSALQRLRRFRSLDFQPPWHKVKDDDIVLAIVHRLRVRELACARTVFVKVQGHSSDPLHTMADMLAVQGADKELDPDEQPVFPRERTEKMVFEWCDARGMPQSQVWGRTAKLWIRRCHGRHRWAQADKTTQSGQFMSRTGAGRSHLGRALQRMWDWSLRHWILAMTPQQYPSAATFAKWYKTDPGCTCGGGPETFIHLQLACGAQLRHPRHCTCTPCRRARARQMAHNRVATLIEKAVTTSHDRYALSVWDRQLDTFLGEILDSDLSALLQDSGVPHHRIQAWRAAVAASGRDKCSPMPIVGQKRSIEQLMHGVKDSTRRERADGLVVDACRGEAFIVEVARTSDDADVMRSRALMKHTKYTSLCRAIRTALPSLRVEQFTFVIGVQGSIDEELWIHQLECLGITGRRASELLCQCMIASVEGSHNVYRAGHSTEEADGT